MAKTRGAHIASPSARNPRPRALPVQDSISEAPQASAIPPSKGGVPSSPSQPRYETRRPPTTLGASTSHPKKSVHRLPTKKAKISGPGETSTPPQLQLPATESQISSRMTLEAIIRRPMVTQPHIEGNLDCRLDHSTSSYVLIWRLLYSSRSLEIHSTYCRDTIWST